MDPKKLLELMDALTVPAEDDDELSKPVETPEDDPLPPSDDSINESAVPSGRAATGLSPEADAVLAQYAAFADVAELSPQELRDGLIVTYVRKLGWTYERFHGDPRGEEPGEKLGADVAILRQHRPATHGERSAVASYCEKYVWMAVHEIAGHFADQLPPIDSYSSGIPQHLLADDSGLGAGMPEPFSNPMDEQQKPDRSRLWVPSGFAPEIAIDAEDQLAHAIKWFEDAPLPDVTSWPILDDPAGKKVVLGAYVASSEPFSLVKVAAEIWALTVPQDAVELLRRDLDVGFWPTALESHLGFSAVSGDSVYDSPSIAAWAPWLTVVNGEATYTTIGSDGSLRPIEIRALTVRLVYETSAGEQELRFPAPILREAWEIVDGLGDEQHRCFINRRGDAVAEYEKRRDLTDYTKYYELLVGRRSGLQRMCSDQSLVCGWCIHLYREIPFAIWPKDASNRRPREDYRYLLLWDPSSGRPLIAARTKTGGT